ncbi:hypothetical protein EON65_33915 [archaeon]|nr:MAG: hypothetical protein EON65_33915 [archaeon]
MPFFILISISCSYLSITILPSLYLGCATCDSTTTGLSNGDCVCPTRYMLAETDQTGTKLLSKTCLACPNGTQVITNGPVQIAGKTYIKDLYACATCPDSVNMRMSLVSGVFACSCVNGYTMVGVSGMGEQKCIPTVLYNQYIGSANNAYIVRYGTLGITINSLSFQHLYLYAASTCLSSGTAKDIQSCQALANLCVLQMYSRTNAACTSFSSIAEAVVNRTYNIDQWAQGMPWLYYSAFSGAAVCKQDIYSTKVSLNDFHLQYVYAAYTLNGTYMGTHKLDNLFGYCTRKAPYSQAAFASTKWQLFASNQYYTFQCDLSSLLDQEQFFYELFLYDSKGNTYTPVPVKVLNYQGSITTDVALCTSSDVFVRRFFLFDVVSGVSSINSYPEVIRYASYISLTVSIVDGKQTSIYPPVLTIEYSESSLDSWLPISPTSSTGLQSSISLDTPLNIDYTSTITFEANYITDLTTFFATQEGFLIAAVLIAGIVFFIRYNNWRLRNSRLVTSATLTTNLGGVNFKNLIELLIMLLHSYVLVMFPFFLLISWYFFVFYKMQVVPSLFLPPYNDTTEVLDEKSPYFLFVLHIYLLTFFQIAYVFIKIIYIQSHADLFFIDWEPTKENDQKGQKDNFSGSVSVWRTILVANEFAELQTERRSNIYFTLFFLGFFLLGLDLQYNATLQPNLNDLEPDQINIILRFGNSTFFWLIISLAQYLFKYFIYERYISEPPEQSFVDFCTIAKVSIIVLDEDYHGYYLHCRSPFQYADANMLELIGFLQQEEAGLTVDRSLDDGPADVQTFQLFLSAEFRKEFNKYNSVLVQPMSLSEYIDNRRQQLSTQRQATSRSNNNNTLLNFNLTNIRKGPRTAHRKQQKYNRLTTGLTILGLSEQNVLPSDRVVTAWKELNSFLTDFVENNHTVAGLKRIIREPSYIENTFRSGPDLTMPEQPSVLLTDRDMQFTRVLFLGQEMDLLLFNILTYALFDLWFNNTMVSILLCYLLNQLFAVLRHQWAEVSFINLLARRFHLISAYINIC